MHYNIIDLAIRAKLAQYKISEKWYLSKSKKLKKLDYNETQRNTLILRSSSAKTVRAVIKEHDHLAKVLNLSCEHIVKIAAHKGGSYNIKAVKDAFEELTALNFSAAQIVQIAGHNGGSHNIRAVCAHTNTLIEAGLSKEQIVKIVGRIGGSLSLNLLADNQFILSLGMLNEVPSNQRGAKLREFLAAANISIICTNETSVEEPNFDTLFNELSTNYSIFSLVNELLANDYILSSQDNVYQLSDSTPQKRVRASAKTSAQQAKNSKDKAMNLRQLTTELSKSIFDNKYGFVLTLNSGLTLSKKQKDVMGINIKKRRNQFVYEVGIRDKEKTIAWLRETCPEVSKEIAQYDLSQQKNTARNIDNSKENQINEIIPHVTFADIQKNCEASFLTGMTEILGDGTVFLELF